jgi:hypothetical protein
VRGNRKSHAIAHAAAYHKAYCIAHRYIAAATVAYSLLCRVRERAL